METISVVDARKQFSELLARVAYARERIVVERKGRPMAVLISLEDLRRFEELERASSSTRVQREAALALATAVRERILAKRQGVPLPDSAELLEQLREERVHELSSGR